MATQDWDLERTKLREKFTTGEITQSTRKELELYLIVLSNSRSPTALGVPDHFEETKAFTNVVRHLLQVRIGQELHEKSHAISVESNKTSARSLWVSIFAVLIAAIAAVFAGLLVYVESQKSHEVNVPTPFEKPALTPSSEKESLPELKLPATNDLSLPLTNSSAASQSALTNH